MDSQQYRRKFVGGDIEITVEYKPPNADQKIGEVILRDPSGCEISVPEAIMADIAHWGRESRIAAQTAAEKQKRAGSTDNPNKGGGFFL